MNITYLNISQSHAKGVEAALLFQPFESLILKANYTYTYAVDTTNALLLKTPLHQGGAGICIEPVKGLSINLDGKYVGKRFDYGNVELQDYVK